MSSAHPSRPVALITGASVGIGYELAKEFAKGGYDLILVARTEEKLRQVADEMKPLGATSDVIVADLARPDAARELFEKVSALGRPVDALVNNAGFGAIGRFHEIDLPRQLEMVQVNVTALVDLTGRFLPGMVARGTGGVLNVASTAGFQPGPWMAIYYASKAFVLSFTEAIAEELAGTGVRATALCPGPTHSEFRRRAKLEERQGVFKNSLIPVMTADAVARAGFAGFEKGKRLVIPGLVNRLAVQSLRIGPRRAVARVAGKINRSK